MDDQYVCWSFFKKSNPFTMKTDNFWIRIVFFESLLCFQLGYFHLSPSKKFSKTPKVLTKFLVKSQNLKSWNYFWWCIVSFRVNILMLSKGNLSQRKHSGKHPSKIQRYQENILWNGSIQKTKIRLWKYLRPIEPSFPTACTLDVLWGQPDYPYSDMYY